MGHIHEIVFKNTLLLVHRALPRDNTEPDAELAKVSFLFIQKVFGHLRISLEERSTLHERISTAFVQKELYFVAGVLNSISDSLATLREAPSFNGNEASRKAASKNNNTIDTIFWLLKVLEGVIFADILTSALSREGAFQF